MMRFGSGHPRRRLAAAALAAGLYVASAVVVPVLHARSEVLRSAPEIETGHTHRCARIRAEGACLVCTSYRILTPVPRALACPERVAPPPARHTPATLPLRRDGSSRLLVRAPPAR